MEAYCYILFSKQLNKFYIGSTSHSVEERLKQHNEKFFGEGFTTRTNDWIVFYSILCDSPRQALQIEKHLKRMKSRSYLENLKKYPEITEKLIDKYK